MALREPLNIIFESAVWSMAMDGFDHSYLSLLLTSHATTILCEAAPDEDDLSHLGAVALLAMTSSQRGSSNVSGQLNTTELKRLHLVCDGNKNKD